MIDLLLTKTFWAAFATLCTGIGMVAAGDTATGIQTIGGSIIAIFMRHAISKITPSQ